MSVFRRQLPKEQIGQVLIQRGVITSEQLDSALRIQKEKGGLLGEILTRLGYAQEEEIAQALAIQHDFPYLPLANYDIDAEVIKLVPEKIVREYCVLPIDKMGDILTVVMANPLDNSVISQIESLTKCKIEIFIATMTEIRKAIQDFYSFETPADGQEGENA